MADIVGTVAAHWDRRATTFDEEPDHGLADPAIRAAWVRRLSAWLPAPPARVADLGCGTGTLAVLLATLGHDVTASDIAPAMVECAHRKAAAARVDLEVAVEDAAAPGLADGSIDVVLVRHLAWTLPDPETAIERWASLLRPDGRLVMVEGRWGTPLPQDHGDHAAADHGDYTTARHSLPWYGGVSANTLVPVLRRRFSHVDHHNLASEDALWGRTVSDERYAVIAHRPRP